MKKRAPEVKFMKSLYFTEHYYPLIKGILEKNEKAVVLADDEIVAWCCFNKTHLHYLHVRKKHRNNHLAKLTIKKLGMDLDNLKVTFFTNDFIKKFKKISFEPYHR